MIKHVTVLSLILIGSVFGGTYRVPEDEPIAKVWLPDDWKTDRHEEFIEAVTPDHTGHVLVLPVEGRKVTETMNEAIRYIRRMGTIRLKADSEKRETAQRKGRLVKTFSWDGTDKDNPLRVNCHVTWVIKDKPLLILFWGSPEAEQRFQPQVSRVLEALEPP